MDPPSPYPLQKSRKGKGGHRACADPETKATSEGELCEPPRTLTNTLSTGRGVFCSDRPMPTKLAKRQDDPVAGTQGGRGGNLCGGPLPAATFPP